MSAIQKAIREATARGVALHTADLARMFNVEDRSRGRGIPVRFQDRLARACGLTVWSGPYVSLARGHECVRDAHFIFVDPTEFVPWLGQQTDRRDEIGDLARAGCVWPGRKRGYPDRSSVVYGAEEGVAEPWARNAREAAGAAWYEFIRDKALSMGVHCAAINAEIDKRASFTRRLFNPADRMPPILAENTARLIRGEAVTHPHGR